MSANYFVLSTYSIELIKKGCTEEMPLVEIIFCKGKYLNVVYGN